MVSSKYITSLIIFLGIVLMWTQFCRQMDSSLNQARLNQDNILLPGCRLRVYSEHLLMEKALKPLFKFVILISYFVVLSGCFYKLLIHGRLKSKVINGHASRQFFQWTVMSLNDYIRDRMNNNLGMHELMKYEWARYESFMLYPHTASLSPLKLARSGFYYTGENKTVKCFCCGEQFDANDYETLNEAHQSNSRNCSFARGEDSSNIPIKHSSRSDDFNVGTREHEDMIPCRNPDYVTEESRRRSFRTWPHDYLRGTQMMVEAGLFYTGTGDLVRCYHCDIGIHDWSDNDNPFVEHARYSPHCHHVRQQNHRFLAQVSRQLDADLNLPIIHSGGEDNRGQSGIIQCRYTNYVTEESRLRSFTNWSHENERQTHALADAGFFYVGIQDCVRCYSCGIGLRGWSDDDDPWIEHVRFSPECQHVRQQKPELNTDHRQEESSSDLISSDMRSKSVQILKHMGYTEDRIRDAFNDLRRSGRNEITLNDLLDNIKNTEPNIYNRDSPSYRMLCTRMNAANNSGDQNESQIASGQQNERPTDTDTLRHRLTCKVCLDKEICIVFLPCGHLVACEDCARNLQTCAVCRADIRESVRTYF
ncbi:baculoviral IAP repeat-containing protein 7-A-like [Ruditapes philippinarum]|uniref:baculoviral IAP repeat-containing protein 7-A-like n=1 Tax=Ruditapes philippinarum TaxID=129788 RepID=UPI00295B03D5|nr:baculoviral IAP repeat-containing protein 7-A-like [Ruditapes philippinarum]